MEVVLSVHDGKPNRNGVIYAEESLKTLPTKIPLYRTINDLNDRTNLMGFIEDVTDTGGIISGILPEYAVEKIVGAFTEDAPLYICMAGTGKVSSDRVIRELEYSSAFLAMEHACEDIEPLNLHE